MAEAPTSVAVSAAVARRGVMLVLSSPSGAGKTTLSRKLLEMDRSVELSVSVTTRRKRDGEIDGRDYHFIDRARFDRMVEGFRGALTELAAMRRREGATLGMLLTQRLDEMAALTGRAEAAPGRRAEAIKARIAEQIEALLDASSRFDPDRLHQEAILIASKADIREELDRLASHVTQAKRLIGEGGAIGRRLDFLSQELNREANTLCSKSNDVALTNIGLELKSVVEQFREQVQNLE